jgi:hypothetical protein
MFEPVQIHGAWYFKAEGVLVGPFDFKDEAEKWGADFQRRQELHRRKNAALDRAIAAGVDDAAIWKAIDDDTLLQFEVPPDEPAIVERTH